MIGNLNESSCDFIIKLDDYEHVSHSNEYLERIKKKEKPLKSMPFRIRFLPFEKKEELASNNGRSKRAKIIAIKFVSRCFQVQSINTSLFFTVVF